MSSGQAHTSLLFGPAEDERRPFQDAARSEPSPAGDTGDLAFDLDTPDRPLDRSPPHPGARPAAAAAAPATAPFRGTLGTTRSRAVRVRSGGALISVEIYVAINADTDPELGRLARGELAAPLHSLMVAGEPVELAVPFLYHEPSRALFALVLPPSLLHRELEERIELLRQLQLEPAGVPIPRYVLQAEVVIGPAGLRALREGPATSATASRAAEPPDEDLVEVLVEAPVEPPSLPAAPAAPADEGRGHGFPLSSIPTILGVPGGPAPAPPHSAPVPVDLLDADATAATRTSPDAEIPDSLDSGAPGSGAPGSGAPDYLSAPNSATGIPRATLGSSLPGIPLTSLAPLPPILPGTGTGTGAGAGAVIAPRLAGHPAADSPAGGTSPGTIDRPIEVASDAFALRVSELPAWQRDLEVRDAEPSGPLTAPNNEALVESGGATLGAPRHLSSGNPSSNRAPTAPLLPSLSASNGAPTREAARPGRGASSSGEPAPRFVRASGLEPHVGDSGATPDTIDEDLSAGMTRATRELPPRADPITTEARDQPVFEPDEWLAHVITAGACDLTVEHGRARVALAATAIGDAEVLRGPLDVRVVLHRADDYPVVVLLFGSPVGLRGDRRDQIAAMCLDVSAERDRAVLSQLARSFEIILEVFAAGRWIRRVLLSAPLAENVAYVLRAADDYLHNLVELGAELSASRACEQVAAPGYDITGVRHPDAEEFCDQQLVTVRTAAQLRAALEMCQRFATPDGEDYLLCVRGFPLLRWRRLRRHVLEQAVTWGIWMGAELARVAVSEGLARSRRDLVHRLHEGFELLQRHPTACDLDEAALAENAAALTREGRALGVVPGKARTLIDSEMDSVVAGTIELVPSRPVVPVAVQSLADLVAALEEPAERLAAALELCRRGAGSTVPPVIAAIARMSRVESVQVLAAAVRLGPTAEAPLIAALTSSKAYIRQGAALALGLLRGDDGVAAIVNLLLTEPTEIWREVARALGQVGPQALHHLARTVRELGSLAPLEERIAWALAHLGARDCHKAIVQMASGHSLLAPIAAKALVLVESAERDQQALVSDVIPPEPTVNRAFSRQFFAAVAGELETGSLDEDLDVDHGSQVISIGSQRGQRRSASEDDL